MKFKLFFLAVFVSLASCSSDDDGNPVNETPTGPVVKNLKEIARYNDGEEVMSELRKFQDNKLTERYIYDQGVAIFSDIYTYNDNGRLSNREAGNENDSAATEIAYDEHGRISAIDVSYTNSGNTFYFEQSIADYTEEGVINVTKTAIQGSDVEVRQYKYYLTADGKVKEIARINGGELTYVCKAEYSGDNLIAYYYNWDSETGDYLFSNVYTYDNETEVKGDFLNVVSNQFGENKANYVLFAGTSIPNASVNYMTENNSNGWSVYVGLITYEFDNSGYPVKQTGYIQGEQDPVSEFIITYQ